MQYEEEEESAASSQDDDMVVDDCEWVLPDATHKQDDRAYVRLVDGKPDDGIPKIWKYDVVRPEGVDGVDYETVVDADEAFGIVQKRNKMLRRREHESRQSTSEN